MLLFICLLFTFSTVYSQKVEKDKLDLNYVMNVNYEEYQSGEGYYCFSDRNLTPGIRFGITNKKLYICNKNYFYYRDGNRKYKFIF